MNALVTASARFTLTPNGTLWTANPSLDYQFWCRYLDVYERIYLFVRAAPCQTVPDGWIPATGPGIVAWPIPDSLGLTGFAKDLPHTVKAAQKALAQVDAVHLRIPCSIGTIVWMLLPAQRPYGVEVVTDPFDVFSPGAVKHPLRPIFRWSLAFLLQRQCAGASAAAYVTAHALQKRYPPAAGAFSTHFSSIVLRDTAFVPQPRSSAHERHSWRLVSVGTLAQLYKAPDVLIDAVALGVREGLDLHATFVGDGKYRQVLEAQAAGVGLSERVTFVGHLSTKAAIEAHLDASDLFVLPSHQEGLPKAMVEAMARGLPCIGSTVGGIPELLPAEDLVPPGDAPALAQKIRAVVTAPERMAHMSAWNLAKAREYGEDTLRAKRGSFYRYVQNKTADWRHTNPAPIITRSEK